MATIVLGSIGTALGGPIGGQIGAAIGSYIDQQYLIPALTPDTKVQGTRISDLKVMASNEGATIPEVWGRLRIGTQVIWSTDFKETATTEDTGGKGGGGNNAEVTSYSYSVSLAVGLCEGVISGIGRVWFDGKIGNLADFNHRIYTGTADQPVDPKISAIQGAANTPAFRDTAYIVFEDMPLEQFGNRIPQITVEVFRATGDLTLENLAKGFTVIPGTTEFGYATSGVMRRVSLTVETSENLNAAPDRTDMMVALDDLQQSFPNCEHVSLVVAWHGTDLRVGECEIRPKVIDPSKPTRPWRWNVGGLDMVDAEQVSEFEGRPALGGAPADRSVFEALQEIERRGLKVTVYPFIIMDIAQDNTLPDPYSAGYQPAYPWRGRITCYPAPGRPGSPDKTATAASQVAAFVGTAQPGDFGWNAGDMHVEYDGPDEWTFRRFILHLATLAQAAGLTDAAFLIGSEMVGLTRLRSGGTGVYPFVNALVDLAADVRTILPDAKISYAADWSEYNSHRPGDGTGDVFFNLDPLWSSADVDFIGVDNYLPLSDWRDGTDHLDYEAGWSSIYSNDYLQSNVEGGENYDWFYLNAEDRAAQTRTPITDGAYGKPWVYRQKDFRRWWEEPHYDRPGGVESGSPTAWTPESKPIVFTEVGCPAVDKGSNQPNVFIDPKSSESFLPYFSNGKRDDQIQRAYLIAFIDYYNDAANNPVSGVYAGPMIDTGRHYVWTWDSRPYPEFPERVDLWADATNWRLGHWLTGRAGYSALDDVIKDIVGDIAAGYGFEVITTDLNVTLAGYMRAAVESPRDTLAPLMAAFFFDGFESGGAIRFEGRAKDAAMTFNAADLVAQEERDFVLTRRQETEVARTLKMTFLAPEADYQSATVYSRRLIGDTTVVAGATFSLCLDYPAAQGIADAMLIENHVKREAVALALPPSALALDAGDVIQLNLTREVTAQIEQIGYAPDRPVTGKVHDRGVYDLTVGPLVGRVTPRPVAPAIPDGLFLDLPLLRPEDAALDYQLRVAARGDPWATARFYRGETLDTTLTAQAGMGRLDADLAAGPLWRWDRVNEIVVSLAGAVLASAPELDVLNGANLAAIQTIPGDESSWELIQWTDAELIDVNQYRLTGLLRGQRGTDAAMKPVVSSGARFVVINQDAVIYASLPAALVGVEQTWRFGPGSQPPSSSTYQTETFTAQGVGRRPFSPVQLEAYREANGDLTLTWVRRTRINGDPWEVVEVPLGEAFESYRLEILGAGSPPVVERATDLSAPTFTYTAAMQTADFGAPVTALSWRVAQQNDSWGVGPFTTAESET